MVDTTHVLAPAAVALMRIVKVLDKKNEANNDRKEGSQTKHPPQPPKRLSVLEEVLRVLDEATGVRAGRSIYYHGRTYRL